MIGARSETYSYDANGNRTDPGDIVGPDNQLLSDGTWTYAYDADGNRVGKTNIATGVSWSYTYDDANRLSSVTETDASHSPLYQVTYTYDVFGNRLEQDTWTAGDATSTVLRSEYLGQQVWADLDGNNQITTRYLDGATVNQMVARETAAGAVGWYLTDNLGSVRVIVDDSGTDEDAIDYDAYGTITYESNPSAGDRFKFAGMQYDATANVYYDHARDYDPATGTWTSMDPLGYDASDSNLDRYVRNDPVTAIDPDGLEEPGVTYEGTLGSYYSDGSWWYTGLLYPLNLPHGFYAGVVYPFMDSADAPNTVVPNGYDNELRAKELQSDRFDSVLDEKGPGKGDGGNY